MLKALGANLILTEGRRAWQGSIAKAEQMVASDPERYVLLQQFKNPANPEIHFQTTGPEIWDDTEGAIDVLVSGVGTGGTITRRLALHQDDEEEKRSCRWRWSRRAVR